MSNLHPHKQDLLQTCRNKTGLAGPRTFIVLLLLVLSAEIGMATTALSANPCAKYPGSLLAIRTDDTVYYNQTVRLKNKRVISGQVVYEGLWKRYKIRTVEGATETVSPDEVELIETSSNTLRPPVYNSVDTVWPCASRHRENLNYFVEARLSTMYSGKDNSTGQTGLNEFTVGPELAGGFRFGSFGLGLGMAYFSSRGIGRIPLFIHARYQTTLDCFSPFLYAQLGTVFDNQSGEAISGSRIVHPGPKVAGLGAGFDYPLLPWLDFSVDIGYRYLQLPTKVTELLPVQQTVVRYNESHGLLLRVGVTF